MHPDGVVGLSVEHYLEKIWPLVENCRFVKKDSFPPSA
jgi:hypothetical protein